MTLLFSELKTTVDEIVGKIATNNFGDLLDKDTEELTEEKNELEEDSGALEEAVSTAQQNRDDLFKALYGERGADGTVDTAITPTPLSTQVDEFEKKQGQADKDLEDAAQLYESFFFEKRKL